MERWKTKQTIKTKNGDVPINLGPQDRLIRDIPHRWEIITILGWGAAVLAFILVLIIIYLLFL